MDTEKIIQDLNRRFSEPLPEFYKRRIIFWYDEDKEFEDKLDEIQISNAKIIVLTGTNNFEVKKLLNVDDTLSNYLVYSPFLYDNLEDNWFLDIELYSEEFRADLISMWMDELKVPQTADLRSGFKKYRKFFNAAERRNKFKALGITPSKVSQLQVAVMAVLAGTDARPNAVLKAILQNGLDMDTNSVYQDFVSYEIHSAFWNMVSQGAGYQENEPTIENLSRHLLLTSSTRTMRQEFLKGLDEYISPAYQAYCYDFVSDWMHGRDSKDIFDIATRVEDELNLPQRFNNNKNMQVSDFLDTEIFPCINEVLLVKLMNDISEHQVDVDLITRTVEKRRTCVWYDELENYFEGILVVARMQKFYKEHSFGFHTVESRKIWEEYTSDYYMMDTYYRQFHKWFSASQKKHHPELSDRFIAVKDNVEGLYINWFLKELGNKWSDACADELANYGRISDTQQQSDFYRSMVAPSNNRVYVIISDAMRYEVAVSLAEQLRRETKSEVKLSSMQGIFPTITKFGMAALLPHNQLSVELKQGKTERLAVLADGQSTEANNRDKLLKAKNPQSVALKYDDIINIKSAERKALVKGMDVVYIYHDVIDAAGHDEKGVFAACDEAIEELKNMVRIICNEFSGTRILITSDHGFLYTNSPLTEDNKVDKTTESEQDIEIGRRYAIMTKGAKPQYLLSVKFLNGRSDYDAFAPRESIRIKMKGGGLNFVHGGISLQEMVVPVIDYHYLRNDSKEYQRNKGRYDTKPVDIGLLSANRKICNMIFSLNFYQKQAVGGNREAATYQLYFTDSNGKTISDVSKLIADRTSDNEQERIFRISFNLKSLKYSNTEAYYLIIADENGLQVQREEFQIDIAFATEEFDFF